MRIDTFVNFSQREHKAVGDKGVRRNPTILLPLLQLGHIRTLMTYPAQHPDDLVEKTATLISSQFSVPPERAHRLAVKAMDGIDAHGGDPHDWKTIEQVVEVVVRSWVSNGLVL